MSYWKKKTTTLSYNKSRKGKSKLSSAHKGATEKLIISELQGMISPRTIQPRIYQLKDGNVQWGQKGTPYTVYANESHYKNNIRNYPVHSYATPIDTYNQIEGNDKIAVNLMKKMLSDFPNAAFWQNGHQDPGCQFNGFHMHTILDSGTNDINNQRSIKNLRTCLRQRGVQFCAQKVKSIEGILVYLQTAPRILIGCNNMRMLTWIAETKSQQVLFQQKDMSEILEDVPAEENKDKNSVSFMEKLMSITNDNSTMSMVTDPPMDFEEALKGQKKKKMSQDAPTRSAKRIDTIMDFIREYDTTIPEIITCKVQAEGDKDRLLL